MACFPGFSSILLIFCLFCSPSRCFCLLSQAHRPVLHDFRSSDQHELFNNLVAQFVGSTNQVFLFPRICGIRGSRPSWLPFPL